MANNCYYRAQIVGKTQDIRELIKMMRWEGKYEHDGLGRIFDVCVIDKRSYGDNAVVTIDGDCAWSVFSSMIDCASKRSLITETKSLNLQFEAYSEEPGIGFQEHVVIDCGILKVSSVVDFETYNKSELSPEEIEEICRQNHLDQETWLATEEDGLLAIGGFSEWNFHNPFEARKIKP